MEEALLFPPGVPGSLYLLRMVSVVHWACHVLLLARFSRVDELRLLWHGLGACVAAFGSLGSIDVSFLGGTRHGSPLTH